MGPLPFRMDWVSAVIRLTFLSTVISANDYDLLQSASQSPCAFPTPQLANFSLVCSRYLQLDYLCDRDGVISRNGAMEIHSGLQDLQLFESGLNQLAIVLVRRISLPTQKKGYQLAANTTSPERKCRELAMVFESEWNVLTTSWSQSEALGYLDFYAETLRSRWFYNAPCERNFLVLVVSEGLFMAGLPIVNAPVISVAYGDIFTTSIPASVRSETYRKATVCLSSSQSSVVSTVLGVVKSVSDELKQLESHPTHFIPQWAVITVVCCFAAVILLLFANWFFISRNTLKARKAQANGDGKSGPTRAGGFLSVMISSRKSENAT